MTDIHPTREHTNPVSTKNRFDVRVARCDEEIHDCLGLRFTVFAQELGAKLKHAENNLDRDRFDEYCTHLMIVENKTNQVVATTRLLTSEGAQLAGSFYSETEFDLENVLQRPGRFMEVGRTCIHPDFRNGAALSLLWQGIAQEVISSQVDYLMGCASIPLSGGDRYLAAAMHHIRNHHFSEPTMRVSPRVPVRSEPINNPDDVILPTLLKGYLRQGAVVCGEPYWDAEWGVADVFVILDCEQITRRYMRHFVDRISA